MRWLAFALVASMSASPAVAQDRSPASILGGIMVAMAVMKACDINLGQVTSQRLVAAAEKMAAAGAVPDAEIEQLGHEFAQQANRTGYGGPRKHSASLV
jgi:hypothetical protein